MSEWDNGTPPEADFFQEVSEETVQTEVIEEPQQSAWHMKNVLLLSLAIVGIALIVLLGIMGIQRAMYNRDSPEEVGIVETVETQESSGQELPPLEEEIVEEAVSDPVSETQEASSETQGVSSDTTETPVVVSDEAMVEEAVFTGLVSSKRVLREGNQLIYEVDLKIIVGEKSQTLKFYPTRNTFQGLNLGDQVVTNVGLTESKAVALLSVSK